jgi:hypothetical protein
LGLSKEEGFLASLGMTVGSLFNWALKAEFGSKLSATWTSTAEERIARACIGGRSDWQIARQAAIRGIVVRVSVDRGHTAHIRVRKEVGPERVGKVRMVQDVVELKAQLKF